MRRQERAALEAVAGRFSANWEEGVDSPAAWLVIDGKRIAVDIAVLKQRAAGPRLRFDKVVIWLMEHLRAALAETVPDGTTVLLTVTAPILLPSKTAAELEARIQAMLGRGSAGRNVKATIHGNDVRMRVLNNESERAPKLIGFVHNRDSDSLLILNATRELLAQIRTKAAAPAPRRARERWLVIAAGEASFLNLCRHVCAQPGVGTEFRRIPGVFGDRRVEMLKG